MKKIMQKAKIHEAVAQCLRGQEKFWMTYFTMPNYIFLIKMLYNEYLMLLMFWFPMGIAPEHHPRLEGQERVCNN